MTTILRHEMDTLMPGVTPDLPRKRVLIAEDHQDLRTIFAVAFNHHQFDVTIAPDGSEALRLLDTIRPDVLVLDMNMPGASGVEVLQYLQAREDLSAMEVIVVTGNYQWQFDPALERVSLFLMKPVNVAELVLFARRLAETPM